MPKPTLYLIDGAGYYFRAYFAIRQYLSNSKGEPTNAVYGFSNMLRKILNDRSPDYALMVFDSRERTFRKDMYELYKANRPQMPDDLARQLPQIDRLLEAYNFPIARMPGFEADDIIGAIATRAAGDGYEVVIVTADKDLMQLVGPGVSIFDSMKDKEIGPDEVMEKFGTAPDKVTDILGLMGDSSDNIPGVPGVGEKTAKALIAEHGGMEEVLAAAPAMKKKKLRENLIEYADQARLSKRLATIAIDAPVDYEPEKWQMQEPDMEKLRAFFREMEFATLLKDIEGQAPAIPRDYTAVLDDETFNAMIETLEASDGFAFDTETTSTNPMAARLVGMSFSIKEGEAWYLPLRHDYDGAPEQLSMELVIPRVRELLEDERIPKYGHNIKYDIIIMAGEGIAIKPVGFDTMIASYILNPSARHGMSSVAAEILNETMIEFSEVCGKGAKAITFNKAPIETATDYAAEDADITFRLQGIFSERIESEGFSDLYTKVEEPLIETLAVMEQNGVLVDAEALGGLSVRMAAEIQEFETKIYESAGQEFNINSPKQLGVILFDELKLPGGRKTKTGFSTDQKTLESLADKHDLPALIVDYRQVAKLKNTYVDALPRMINEKTGRIHTSFNQTVAATGRLSSSDPNLQNIPIRTEAGRQIRQTFIAPEGYGPDFVRLFPDRAAPSCPLLP